MRGGRCKCTYRTINVDTIAERVENISKNNESKASYIYFFLRCLLLTCSIILIKPCNNFLIFCCTKNIKKLLPGIVILACICFHLLNLQRQN